MGQFCEKCGRELEPGGVVCTACGAVNAGNGMPSDAVPPVLSVNQQLPHESNETDEGKREGLFGRLLHRGGRGAGGKRRRVGEPRSPITSGKQEEATSTLSSSAGGDESTMVLGIMGQPALLRASTGERYRLTVPAVLGKGSVADCVIAGNPAISRRHAEVREIEGAYYMVDNGSTNGTWVDEVRVAPGRPQPLHDGSVVVFADENFTFQARAG